MNRISEDAACMGMEWRQNEIDSYIAYSQQSLCKLRTSYVGSTQLQFIYHSDKLMITTSSLIDWYPHEIHLHAVIWSMQNWKSYTLLIYNWEVLSRPPTCSSHLTQINFFFIETFNQRWSSLLTIIWCMFTMVQGSTWWNFISQIDHIILFIRFLEERIFSSGILKSTFSCIQRNTQAYNYDKYHDNGCT